MAWEARAENAADLSLARILGMLRRHARLVAAAALIGLVLGASFALLRPRPWVASSRFTPRSSEGMMGNLAGLAAQFGINVPQQDVSESPEFYAELLTAREILTELAATEFTFDPGSGAQTATLAAILDAGGDSPRDSLNRTIEVLRSRIGVSINKQAGLVQLNTQARWPVLAEAMNARLLELVADFNLAKRQSQAAAERRFVEERARTARAELEAAEAELEAFLEQNRRFEAPQLNFERSRLQRRVDLHQQVYTSIAQAHEQAKIEEVRNTPVITIVDGPARSAQQPDRNTLLYAFAGMLAGLAGAVALLQLNQWRLARRNPARGIQPAHPASV